MDFEQWLYKVCELRTPKGKEVGDIYQNINLTQAKLAFLEGLEPIEYVEEKSNNYENSK